MMASYTQEDLQELEERVLELEDEYGLTVAARESLHESWRNVLESATIPYDEISDEQLEESAQSAAMREANGGVYDTVVPEDAVFVDLTQEEPREEDEERERFSEWSDEKVERKHEEALQKLADLYNFEDRLGTGADQARKLDQALDW